MRVRSLIALSFFAACAAVAADNTPPVAPVKPVQDNYYDRTITDPGAIKKLERAEDKRSMMMRFDE